jgi:hypothetical protein
LIVRNDVLALLCVGEVIQNDHGHFLKPKLAGGKKTSVAGQDVGCQQGSGC